jgi:hypothetical protein
LTALEDATGSSALVTGVAAQSATVASPTSLMGSSFLVTTVLANSASLLQLSTLTGSSSLVSTVQLSASQINDIAAIACDTALITQVQTINAQLSRLANNFTFLQYARSNVAEQLSALESMIGSSALVSNLTELLALTEIAL